MRPFDRQAARPGGSGPWLVTFCCFRPGRTYGSQAVSTRVNTTRRGVQGVHKGEGVVQNPEWVAWFYKQQQVQAEAKAAGDYSLMTRWGALDEDKARERGPVDLEPEGPEEYDCPGCEGKRMRPTEQGRALVAFILRHGPKGL